MEMTEITITVPKEVKDILSERAIELGQDVSSFMAQVAEREAHMPRSLRELFAPVREQIKASGVTDEQLAGEIDAAIAEVRRARKNKRD